ncbi:acyltransferase [Zestomonas carbonaria]|uniref:Putative acyltransferase YihG n=1 Tax=Zestomonas carbonaria TaxID=2762745 RepID=A0A7U7I7Y4_9GAMM|nr:acyltransferase [Pseudomonas carbonaria]CAD5106571.1 putative acyltransferase YihG [Pseudomonas carbonaria]
MRRLITGLTVSLLLLVNTLALIGPMMLIAVFKLILPGRRLTDACSFGVMWIAETWAEIDKWIFTTFTPTRWDIRGAANLRRDTSYLIVSNHQSWVDIPALIQVFNRRAPFFKFFLKKELVWVPFLGLAWWALEYPFMKRYSKTYLAKYPEKKGQDLLITRQACEKFKRSPVTVVNYLEGTRFTPAKHDRQQSPYRYLLKPKAGGVAFVLAALGEQLDALLDVTVYYPGGRVPGFWELASGQVETVVVDIRTHTLDPALWAGNYEDDPQFRQFVQDWVSNLWAEKDARLAALREEFGDTPFAGCAVRTGSGL